MRQARFRHRDGKRTRHAWLDPSTATDSSSNNVGSPQLGRYANGITCGSYPLNAATVYGFYVTPKGTIETKSCDAARSPAACKVRSAASVTA